LGLQSAKSDGAASFIKVQQGYTQMSGLAESYDTNMLAKVRADQRHKEEVIEVENAAAVHTSSGPRHPSPRLQSALILKAARSIA
jgi:hypothetical protein